MDLSILVAASRPSGVPKPPPLPSLTADLDHITGPNIKRNHDPIHFTAQNNSPRLEELSRPRNTQSKMSLGHVRESQQMKKNSDRLPDFTLNYLELIDSCMDNLT